MVGERDTEKCNWTPLTPLTKINSKWIKDINLRADPMNLLEENVRKKLIDIGLANGIFGHGAKSTNDKSKTQQMRLHQTQKLCSSRQTINTMKRQPTEWEKEFANHVPDKGLISKIY